MGDRQILLVVDDESSILDLIKSFLENNYDIIITNDAIDAIKRSRDHKIDLLIADINMPAMSGKELSTKIRKMNHRVKVLYISGNISDSVIDKADVDSDFDYIEKPFTRKELIEKVENLLNS